jgi:thioredoxin-dependent peroxiredoxin
VAKEILAVGEQAPAFTLPATGGRTVSLSDYVGKRPVVLFFYPKASTPGCTVEACSFRDSSEDFTKRGVAVLGISPDPVAAVDKFSRKHRFDYPLLADTDHMVAEAYGVWQRKSMFGIKYMGIVRSTFVVGKDGRIAQVFPNVRVIGHVKRVLRWVEENLK